MNKIKDLRVVFEGKRNVFTSTNNTDFAVCEALRNDDRDNFELNGKPVLLCSIIGPTGEIRWYVHGWKEYEDLSESEQAAVNHFGLSFI